MDNNEPGILRVLLWIVLIIIFITMIILENMAFMNDRTPNKQEPDEGKAYEEGYRKGFNDSLKYYVYDKINKKEAKHWFQDNEGNFYINADPHGANMDGSFKVKMISNKFKNQQFEIRKRNFNNENE